MKSERKNTIWGIGGAFVIILFIAILFALNFILPLHISPLPSDHFSNFTSRIWAWLEYVVGIAAVVVIVHYRASILKRDVIQATVLAGLNWIGRYTMNRGLYDATTESVITALAFTAAVVMFRKIAKEHVLSIKAFAGERPDIVKSILYGIAFAIPLSVVNIAYFWFASGPRYPGNLTESFLGALHPGISEEIIFRYFIIALSLLILHGHLSQKLLVFTTLFLAVVPHSLAHLPDLMLSNPGAGVFLLVMTSLLFGLPMALLQVKKNLESAISFHWFIDFTRFLLGF